MELKIDAHVVRQLGEELITGHEQAILELVKNSYDADSKWCKISIDTECKAKYNMTTGSLEEFGLEDLIELSEDEELLSGKISVSDAGDGMDVEQINKGWLTISFSEKRTLKTKNLKTKKHDRSIQGDKGLGRLSAMRLGNVLRINTNNGTSNPVGLIIDWREFAHGTTLDKVPVHEVQPKYRTPGTEIAIFGLSDSHRWIGLESIQKVKAHLSSLINPFFNGGFRVSLNINGVDQDLDTFEKGLQDFVNVESDFTFDGEGLSAIGFVKLPFFLPNVAEGEGGDSSGQLSNLNRYRRYVKYDGGEKLLRVLKETNSLKGYDIRRSNKPEWFLEFSKKFLWSELLTSFREEVAPPGNFESKWYNIVKRGVPLSSQELTKRQYTPELKTISESLVGVGIYKNEFRVGHNSNTDWIGFSKDTTSGKGFYSLRPNNVIGYISFQNYEGETLKETSDRQGFVEDNVYSGFKLLTDTMKSFVNDFLNNSRRAHNLYVKKCITEEEMNGIQYSAVESVELINNLSNKAKVQKGKALESKNNFIQMANELQSYVGDKFNLDSNVSRDIEFYIDRIKEEIEKERQEQDAILQQVENINFNAQQVLDELERYQERSEDLFDSAAVGLSAESLAHDINPILTDMLSALNFINKMVRSNQINKVEAVKKIRLLKSSLSLISKEISIINPMLRSKRLQHYEFSIKDEISSFIEMKHDRLESKGVSVKFYKTNVDAKIKMPLGKFMQVFDNLFRNSEFWTLSYKEKIDDSFIPQISIEQNGAAVTFYDNGPGIRSDLGNTIFDMFVSGRSGGHGLGLYIVKNILEQSKSTIDVIPERNELGNNYKFYIDFTGAEV